MLDALGIDLKTMLFSMVNFLILVGVLGKFLYKPFLGMLAERKRLIKEKFDRADAVNAEADAKMAEYTAQIANAEEEGRAILKEAKERAEAMSDKIIADAKAEAGEIIANAEKTIALERETAVENLRDEIASLALLAAEQIVGREIETVGHDVIVDNVIKNARSSEWQS
ncbi:MAG: F0F1 ATP synthase subunit B [Clostridiales bacterium]|nr:F0F1 ATP synthase subunit B [Candidatus Crickella merdequi]